MLSSWSEMQDPNEFTYINLRDGTTAMIRAIRADDAPRLQSLLARLSPEARYRRFFALVTELPHEDARRLSNLDYCARMAWVASLVVQGEEQIIAIGRYAAADPSHPEVAEIAFAIEDRYQGQGLGKFLWRHLLDFACAHGIRTLLAVVQPTNEAMLRLVRGSGLPYVTTSSGGLLETAVDLRPLCADLGFDDSRPCAVDNDDRPPPQGP